MNNLGIFKDKKDVIEKLIDLDFELGKIDIPNKLEFVIFGGTAVLLYTNHRVTSDIDVVLINDFSIDGVLKILEQHNVSNRMECIMEAPEVEDFYKRTHEINVEFNNLIVRLASIEDVIISKIFSSRGDNRDLKDLVETDLLDKANMELVSQLYYEYKKYVIFHEMRYNNLEYVVELREKFKKGKETLQHEI